MATIVRVKRRRDEEPVENIIVSCKRRKNEQDDSNIQSSLTFAGTVKSLDEVVSKHIRDAIRKEKLQKEYKQHHVDIASKSRQIHRQHAKAARFKVTSSFRSQDLDNLDLCQDVTDSTNKENREPQQGGASGNSDIQSTDSSVGETSTKVFQLYDVEVSGTSTTLPTYESIIQESQNSSGITCNTVPPVQEQVPRPGSEDADYVYDLYYTNNRDFNFGLLESALTIHAMSGDLVCDYQPDGAEDDEVYEDEDDSNDEDNWRNDYPDEDPHFFENQEAGYSYGGDLNERQAFADPSDEGLAEWMNTRCNIEDADELSSEDEDCAYFGEPLNPKSAGTSYSSYYRRVGREMGEGQSDPDDDKDDEND